MAHWDADAEVDQAFYFREQAYVARNIGQHALANLFEQIARLAMTKAEIFQALDKLHLSLAEQATELEADRKNTTDS
jgi:hypothetical protein